MPLKMCFLDIKERKAGENSGHNLKVIKKSFLGRFLNPKFE
jgi:hypothetical protein